VKLLNDDSDVNSEPTRDFVFILGWIVAWLLVAVALVWLAGSVRL